MDHEASLYGQEMESERDWALFGGQLLTFPETLVNFDAIGGGSVLQLEQSTSDEGWSLAGPLNKEEDNVTLQDSVWLQNVDVGESLELFSSTLDGCSDFIEKDSALSWLQETEILDEPEVYLNCIDKANDECVSSCDCDDSNDQLSMGNCEKFSDVSFNGLSFEAIGVTPEEKVRPDHEMNVNDLENLPVKIGCHNTIDEEYTLGDCIYVDSSAQFEYNNKRHKQTGNTSSSSKLIVSKLSLVSHGEQAASEIVASGHEEEDVEVDLLDSDDASVFKLLEDLDEECISGDTGKHKIVYKTTENKTRHAFTSQTKVVPSLDANNKFISDPVSESKPSSFSATNIKLGQSHSSTLQNVPVAKSFKIIPKANPVCSVVSTSSSAFNHFINTGSIQKLIVVTSKSGLVSNCKKMKPETVNSSFTHIETRDTMAMSLSSLYAGTTLDTTALIADNDASSNDSSCLSFSKAPDSQKYEGFELLPKAEPVFRAIVRSQPYEVTGKLSERKLRKKEQNVRAALRYRQKKREEKGHVLTEVEKLEQDNERLRSRAEELFQEISYLKNLLEEIQN